MGVIRRALVLALGAAGLVGLAAGCGGASKTTGVASLSPTAATTSSSVGPNRPAGARGTTLALEFANCMRSHGVASFPDPGGPIVPGIKQLPGFRSAMATCNRLYPSGRSTGVPFTEAQRTAALHIPRTRRKASWMREDVAALLR